MRHSAFIPILVLFIGCSSIPCSPPEYYTPEEGAPWDVENHAFYRNVSFDN